MKKSGRVFCVKKKSEKCPRYQWIFEWPGQEKCLEPYMCEYARFEKPKKGDFK
jgi:hypothetical protein